MSNRSDKDSFVKCVSELATYGLEWQQTPSRPMSESFAVIEDAGMRARLFRPACTRGKSWDLTFTDSGWRSVGVAKTWVACYHAASRAVLSHLQSRIDGVARALASDDSADWDPNTVRYYMVDGTGGGVVGNEGFIDAPAGQPAPRFPSGVAAGRTIEAVLNALPRNGAGRSATILLRGEPVANSNINLDRLRGYKSLRVLGHFKP